MTVTVYLFSISREIEINIISISEKHNPHSLLLFCDYTLCSVVLDINYIDSIDHYNKKLKEKNYSAKGSKDIHMIDYLLC